MAIRLNGWRRLWVVLSALWFFGWLVGFPLYVRSKDLASTELFFQKFLEWRTEPKSTLTTEESERLDRVFQWVESLPKNNPRLASELDEEDRRFTEEAKAESNREFATEFFASQSTLEDPEEWLRRVQDRVNKKRRQQLKNSLYKQVLLTAAKEDASLADVYKRLLKSNWSGWGLYVLLGPLVAYAGISGGILAVRWVMHGFHNSAGV